MTRKLTAILRDDALEIGAQQFVPATMERPIGGGVFFRPIKSWHSNTYAGEGLTTMPGSQDRSGCLLERNYRGLKMCSPPLSVVHRVYWHKSNPEKIISASLSYPHGMGACDVYFWEALGVENDDVTRWIGKNAERDMEKAIKAKFLADLETAN